MQNHTKPAWHIAAEIKLKRLESEANQARETAQAIYGELTDLSQQRNRLQERRQALASAPKRGGPNTDPEAISRQITAQQASVDAELNALVNAIADCTARRLSAQTVSGTKIALFERAKKALHAAAGGIPFASLGLGA